MEINKQRVNSVLTAQSISKLLDKIKDQRNNSTELKYLRERFILSEDAVVSLTAAKALVTLVESEIVPISSALPELVSSLSLTRSIAGISEAIFNLLQLDLKHKIRRKEEYKCVYNVRAPQHPLIAILNQAKESWSDILIKINDFYAGENELVYYANELFYPFYLYVTCNPNDEVSQLFQHKLWNHLIHVTNGQSIDLRLYIIAWLQMSKKTQVIKMISFLIDGIQLGNLLEKDLSDVLILWLASLLYEVFKCDCDPRNILMCLTNVIKTSNGIEHLASPLLMMLGDCILLCPAVYLFDLLMLCKHIVLLNTSNIFAVQMIRMSLLQWLAYKCSLTTQSICLANDILLQIQNCKENTNCKTKQLFSNKFFLFLNGSNNYVHLAVELSITSELLTPSTILEWLNKMEKLSLKFLKNIFNYLAALLLHKLDDCTTLKIISILNKISKPFKELTTYILILYLWKLSNTLSSRIHFTLLKAIPKLAVLRENVPLIINTLDILKKGFVNLKSFSITLYYDLWETNTMCYSYLQNALVSDCKNKDKEEQWWEFQVTKAYVLKKICIKCPEVHGTELVAYLSEILNMCNDVEGSVPSALAIEGIKALWNGGIIDFTSTWSELSRRCDLEERPPVIKSLCSFMSDAAYLDISEYSDKLLEDIINKLWSYGISHHDIEVVSAAFNALKCFTLEQVSLYLPSLYMEGMKNSEHSQFGYISGECWINLLKRSQESSVDIIGDFLIKHVSNEIAGYRNASYIVSGHKEPSSFNYLPDYSIVRALGNYLKSEVGNWKQSFYKHVYLQCLRILSHPYSKPLPPMDWCFLQELIHISESRSACICLASKQVQLSGTARRLVENYITALTDNTHSEEDIITIFKNLKHLCNSIQPVTLRPFIEYSIEFGLQSCKDENEKMFDSLVTYLKQALIDTKLLESNKLVLSQIIVKTARRLKPEETLFTKLLECIVVLQSRCIDDLSSPMLWNNSSETIKLSVKVRCKLSLCDQGKSLKWLNDVIEEACFIPLHHDYILKNITEVIRFYRGSETACMWILELLGNIQSTIANESTSLYQIQFLCDVFIMSMVILAGQDIFVFASDDVTMSPEPWLHLFPYSISFVLDEEGWKSSYSQVSEWLYHMTNYHDTPNQYKLVFYQSLVALRHNVGFENTSKWMKFIGCRINYNFS